MVLTLKFTCKVLLTNKKLYLSQSTLTYSLTAAHFLTSLFVLVVSVPIRDGRSTEFEFGMYVITGRAGLEIHLYENVRQLPEQQSQ